MFDLDGTLADTASDLTRALNHVLGEIGRATLAFETTRPFVSRGARALIRLGLDTTDDDPHIEALLPRFLAYYACHLADETCLFPGIDEILGGLAARGIPWGVVTNKTRALTVPLLERLGLSYPPAVVVCGDDLAVKKPHPAPLRRASAELGALPFHCVYVGDDRRDVVAGLRAGMPTVVAGWGYLGPGETPATWGAHHIAADPPHLGTLIGL